MCDLDVLASTGSAMRRISPFHYLNIKRLVTSLSIVDFFLDTYINQLSMTSS
jgi:hypothetical protein